MGSNRSEGQSLASVRSSSTEGRAGHASSAPASTLEPSPGNGDLRRSLALVTVAWVFGSVWFTATSGAPLTQFARSLGATNFQYGVLTALPYLASLLAVPGSLIIDRTGRRKGIFMWCQMLQRFAWFPIALVPVWMVHRGGRDAAPAAMMLFLVMMGVMHALNSVGGTAWVSWMADLVPERVRGKYFSRRRQLGILSGIPAAVLAGWALDRTVHPGDPSISAMITLEWCAILFCAAAVFGVADIALFKFVPEVPARPREDHRSTVRQMFSAPLSDRQFLWFGAFVATLTFAVSFMGQFVTLYLIEKLGVTNKSTQLMLLVVPSVAQLLVLPVWGHAADRMGKKPVLAIAALGLVPVGFGWCFMNSGGAWSIWLGYFLAAAGAALWTGVEVANFNLVLELSGADEDGLAGSSYVAVNSVIVNVAGFAGGLASGVVAGALGDWHWQSGIPGLGTFTFYELLFAVSGALRLAAVVVFLPMIHEPHARPTVEALRFMTANIYNNLFSAVALPLRAVGIGESRSNDAAPEKP